MPFRILIADDHPAIRKVLRALIESHAEWQVCGESENGVDAVRKAVELKPDLVILDLAMPIADGIRAAREISNALPGTPMLMHTMHSSPELNLEAKKAGVTNVVSKGTNGNNLINAITEILKGAQDKTANCVGGLAEGGISAIGDVETQTIESEKTSNLPAPMPRTDESQKPD